jgi:hypothetical protein
MALSETFNAEWSCLYFDTFDILFGNYYVPVLVTSIITPQTVSVGGWILF